MIQLSSAADFAYGNTRLRARKAELLGAEEYESLLGRDLDGVLELLADTAYRAEIEAALAVTNGKHALHVALGRHLARTLGELRAFYEGRSRELVDLLLSRFDLHNLLALLRGRVRGQAPEQVLANVVPLGALGGAAAQEIARQQELARAVDLLVSWRLPDAAGARALADAWPEYERTEDLAALEHALVARRARRLDEALRAAGASADSLRELVAREHDAVNVLVVLRLRFALQLDELSDLPPAPGPGRFLAGGTDRRGGARGRAAPADARRGRREARRGRTPRGLACAAAAHRLRRRPAHAAARARSESRPLGRRAVPPRRPTQLRRSDRVHGREGERGAEPAAARRRRGRRYAGSGAPCAAHRAVGRAMGQLDRRSRHPSSSRATGWPASRRDRSTPPARRQRCLHELLEQPGEGDVIAVHEPFFNELPAVLRRRIDSLTSPLVVALPGGEGANVEAERRAQHLRILWEAVGYQITFDREGDST